MDHLTYLSILRGPELQVQGLDPIWRFGMADRVRDTEIDAQNHVNHRVPLAWFETLRMQYLRDYGLVGADGPDVLIRNLELQYHAPLFAGESYIATARTSAVRRSALRMELAAFSGDLRVSCRAVVVFARPGTGEKAPLTEAARQTLITRDDAQVEG